MKFWCFKLVVALLASVAATAATAQSLVLVPSQATLQQAINQVADGGVIEIASGTYPAPANGFQASNLSKSFTMRAAVGASVTLTGSNTTDILRVANGAASLGRPITFERLTFANGRTTNGALGGGLTLSEATVNFVGCTFQNNVVAVPAGGGGGAISSNGSNITLVGAIFSSNSARQIGSGGAIRANNTRMLILDSTFTANDAWQSGGAILAGGGSRLFIHNTRFENNRTNLPNHFVDSLGGAIALVDSQLRATNSRFAGNRTGYSGGAIYAFGWWTATTPTEVITANTTFVDNVSERDASVAGSNVPVGGAVQVEDQATITAYNTRFITNRAQIGGAISSYRAIVNINDSAFHGNSVTGTIPGAAMGGAIAASSEDSDALDGQVNRRSTSITIRNSLFQGRFGSVGNAARSGGCLYVVGDLVRAYGLGGNTQMGTISENRASLTISGSAFYDCDVAENGGGGLGGGGILQLTTLQLSDSLFAGCDATPNATNTGSGGALFVFDNSDATVQRTAFIRSSAGFAGGAIYSQGSHLNVTDSRFAENQLVGTSRWGGSAIWTGWENIGAPRPAVNATGLVQSSVLSNNTGAAAVLDYDASNAPFNLMQYGGNSVFPNNTTFYSNAFTTAQTVAQVNVLSLHGQPKAPSANTGLGSAPPIVALRTVPPRTLPTYAVGDPAQPTASFAAYAWSGGGATFDGSPVSGNMGLTSVAPGTHVLAVGATSTSAATTAGATPATDLRARPKKIGSGMSTTLLWTQLGGTFLEQFIDLGVNLPPPGVPSGSIVVTPGNRTQTYRSLLVTEEGGASDDATVTYIADLIFADGWE